MRKKTLLFRIGNLECEEKWSPRGPAVWINYYTLALASVHVLGDSRIKSCASPSAKISCNFRQLSAVGATRLSRQSRCSFWPVEKVNSDNFNLFITLRNIIPQSVRCPTRMIWGPSTVRSRRTDFKSNWNQWQTEIITATLNLILKGKQDECFEQF